MHLLQTEGNLHGVTTRCEQGYSGWEMSAKKRKAWLKQPKNQRNGRAGSIQTIV